MKTALTMGPASLKTIKNQHSLLDSSWTGYAILDYRVDIRSAFAINYRLDEKSIRRENYGWK